MYKITMLLYDFLVFWDILYTYDERWNIQPLFFMFFSVTKRYFIYFLGHPIRRFIPTVNNG